MSMVSTDLSQRVCPACGQQDALSRGQKNNFRIFSCCACSSLYAVENSSSTRNEDYDSYYTPENLEVPAFINRRLDEIVSTFEPYRKNNRLLDVGFGAGSFLEAAARNNWQPFGVQVSQTAVEHVREHDFQACCAELEKESYP